MEGTLHERLGAHPRVTEARQHLFERELLVEDGSGTPAVPRSVLLHPEGPGLRRDTPWGVFRRLPPAVRRAWLQSLGLEPNSTDLRGFAEMLFSSPPPPEERRFLEEEFESRGWRDRARFPSLPETLEDLYAWAGEASDPLAECVLRGRLLPGWKGENVTGLLVSRRHQKEGENSAKSKPESPNVPGDEEWERMPFGYRRQLKILLVLADGIPFRSTEEKYPYLFDLKEAARLTGWSLDHVHALSRRNMEQELLASNGERFCMTGAAKNWAQNARPDDLLLSAVPLQSPGEDAPSPHQPDGSSGRLLWAALRMARRREGPFTLDGGVETLANHPSSWEYVVASHTPLVDAENQRRRAAADALRTLHWLGFLDGVFDGETVRFLRLNERGQQLIENPDRPVEDASQLPFILQPDGTLMVPLEAPLEDFRRINPYALLVNVDNMIEYRIDRQSLVQSLNDGWDASAFYRFLSERADRIPDPVQELFDEVAQPAEKVQLEEVHHLLRFENGATASKALRALSNYKPERIGEKEILLRSKTTEETIRRNLSRGGVRLQNAEGPARSASPVLDVAGGEST